MSLPMCTDVEASAPIRNPHRPMSVPMLQHTSPLENLTSADVGTDVAGCFARSSPLRFHIGRCRYRCCRMPGLPLQDYISADVGTDVAAFQPPLENLTSADVGTDVVGCQVFPFEISHRPMSVPMLQDARSSPSRFYIGRCRYRCCSIPAPLEILTSADVGTDVAGCFASPSEISHRPMSVPMLQDARSSPSRFHIGRCRYRCLAGVSISPGLAHRPISVPMCHALQREGP